MCGIAGTYGPPPLDVELMLDRIEHRGPDGRGTFQYDGAMHGHVRLSIQDPLPRSNQPFLYDNVCVSYVGELWNVHELRSQLQQQGYVFKTTGDTEVVAAACHCYGTGAVMHMDGMFALAVSDPDQTWIARDRFGKVPLYFLPAGGGLFAQGSAWASERKAFAELSPEAYAVLPGEVIHVSDQARSTRYYRLTTDRPTPEKDAGRVRDLLRQGVERRLISDVPVCCLISGGLDSALILRMVRERIPDVVAYHAYLDPASPDLAAARRLADEWGVELREVQVSEPTEEDVRAAVATVEVPMKAQVEIALLCLPLARRMREDGFRVVLSGESADEIFGGYGNLARKAKNDLTWKGARLLAVDKMARGNFCRVNKVFMAHGVEGRLPFMERGLVELALSLGVKDCPPGKGLLKEAARGLVPDWVIARQKETFQGAGGTISACAHLYESPAKAYNQIARELFGTIPRD